MIKRGNRIDTLIRLTPDDLILMQNQQEMMTNPELSAYMNKWMKALALALAALMLLGWLDTVIVLPAQWILSGLYSLFGLA